jgi:tetratricopeptide (TPR) repeat protein
VSGFGRWLVIAAAVGGFGVAGWWSARLGWADYWSRQDTVAGTEKALAAMPDQAEYHVRLAALLADENPRRAVEELRRAVSLNPLDAQSWIELGLRAERSGDSAGAERCLLRAAEADRKYLPRWTLMAFYLRRNDLDSFWSWARAAAGMVYGDPTPLFRLCGRVSEDGQLIERLEIHDPDVMAGYLSYLLREKHVALIGPATRRILEQNRQVDVPPLLEACDRLIEANRSDEAMEIWNRLGRAGRIPFATPRPSEGILTNGRFAVPPTSRGFDWRLPGSEGISAAREENPPGLRLTFSARLAEYAEALAQFAPAQEGTGYQLRFRYRTSGIAPGTGLAWRITDLSGASLGVGKSLSSDQEIEDGVTFRTPSGCRIVRVALVYQRSPGTTRIEGFLILRNVVLEPAAQPPSDGVPRSRVMK